MSFISTGKGKGFEPGWFLKNDENAVRETRQMISNGVEADESGRKIVKMGTAYPANDATAEGIVYEDIDVTTGDKPGSVVTKGEVYKDRLAITGESYDAVADPTGKNPAEEGWYTQSGTEGAYVYTLTTDTTPQSETTYYKRSDVRLALAAETALKGLGFNFITAPKATRQ